MFESWLFKKILCKKMTGIIPYDTPNSTQMENTPTALPIPRLTF